MRVWFERSCVAIIVAAVWLAAAEAVLRLVWTRVGPDRALLRLSIESAGDRAAAAGFFDETQQTVTRVDPLALWRGRPFSGRYLNIDSDGCRRVVEPEAAASSSPVVFVYGGSTIWGWGVDDARTIPSLLARTLAADGTPARVFNRGQVGFVSAQEATSLFYSLTVPGPRPDVVVFLDGINDASRTAESGEPGATYASEMLISRDLAQRNWLAPFHRLKLAKVLRGATPPAGPPAGEPAALARLTASHYAAVLEQVRAIAARARFQPLFYWQPEPSMKRSLSDAEKRAGSLRFRDPEAWAEVYRAATGAVRRAESGSGDFHDVSGLFRDETATVYLDYVHYTESANLALARRIASDVEAALKRRRTRRR